MQSRRRGAIPADQTLKLVSLELKVGTPDSLLRAHNLARGLCESVEALLSRYEDILSRATFMMWRRKGPLQDLMQQVPASLITPFRLRLGSPHVRR